MLITVIMANFNGALFIEEGINSVLQQDYSNFEFLIIDDGSGDNSKAIIKLYAERDRRIKPIFKEENSGQGECLNAGIEQSNGDIITFLDSDDYWLPGKLNRVAEIFSTKNNISLYQHNLLIVENKTLTDRRFLDVMLSGDCFGYAKKTNVLPFFSPTSGLAVSKPVIKKVGPIPSAFRVCADGYLTRTSMCWGEVISDYQCYGAYRNHENNATYGNRKYSEKDYINRTLIPSLNRYYESNNFGTVFVNRSFRDKLLDTSLRKILNQYIFRSG